MKKLAATLLSLLGLALYTNAQGTFVIDSGANFGNGSSPTATTGGLVWDNTVLETSDINIGLLWGTSESTATTHFNLDPLGLNTGIYAGSGNWIASQATGAGDMTSYGGGAIFDPNGNTYVVPGEAAGTTIWLVLQGWTGNGTSYDSGTGPFQAGETTPFSIVLAVNTSPIQPDTHGMSALVLGMPEPSLPALSALGAMAFMSFRRRKPLALKTKNPTLL
jgi:hypothetical protein